MCRFSFCNQLGGILKESLTKEHRGQLARIVEEQWPERLFEAANEGLEVFITNLLSRRNQLRSMRKFLLESSEPAICLLIHQIEEEFCSPAGRLRHLSGIVDGRKPIKLKDAAEEGDEAFLRNLLDRLVRLGVLQQALLDSGGHEMRQLFATIEKSVNDPDAETKKLKLLIADEDDHHGSQEEGREVDRRRASSPSERFERVQLGLPPESSARHSNEQGFALVGDDSGVGLVERVEAEFDRRSESGRHLRPT